jgi:DNA-binding transcriptional LysR family regulator
MDSLTALNTFVRAAEAGNFKDAGRQLSLSSSAVGKTISRLEERHGVRFFHRSTRSITLTQEGKTFLESCRRILLEVNRVASEFEQKKSAPKGRLKASLPSISMVVLPTISEFLMKYPDIELDIDFTDHPIDVIEGGYDVVVKSGEVTDSRLMSRRFGPHRFVVVGSPAYFGRVAVPLTPPDLAEHACLRRRNASTGKLDPWPLTETTSTILPETLTANNFEALIAFCELGHGVACVPEFAVRRQISEGTLKAVLQPYIQDNESFCALWPTSQYLSPRLRVFLDFLAKDYFPHLTISAERPEAELAAFPLANSVGAIVPHRERSEEYHQMSGPAPRQSDDLTTLVVKKPQAEVSPSAGR